LEIDAAASCQAGCRWSAVSMLDDKLQVSVHCLSFLKAIIAKTVQCRTSVVTDHETTRLPVRSALFKQCTSGLVVRWVTTSEYPLLYVFAFLLLGSIKPLS
jgi:hypothetical protein